MDQPEEINYLYCRDTNLEKNVMLEKLIFVKIWEELPSNTP